MSYIFHVAKLILTYSVLQILYVQCRGLWDEMEGRLKWNCPAKSDQKVAQYRNV